MLSENEEEIEIEEPEDYFKDVYYRFEINVVTGYTEPTSYNRKGNTPIHTNIAGIEMSWESAIKALNCEIKRAEEKGLEISEASVQKLPINMTEWEPYIEARNG